MYTFLYTYIYTCMSTDEKGTKQTKINEPQEMEEMDKRKENQKRNVLHTYTNST